MIKLSADNETYLGSAKDLLLFYKNLNRKKELVALKIYIKSKIEILDACLDKLLDEVGGDHGEKAKDLLRTLTHELSQIKLIYQEINQPFSLFIMGRGKQGKSTLINALIGSKKAEIDFLPKTWKIDVFQNLPHGDRVTIYFADGSCKSVTEEEASRILKEEEIKREESEKVVNEELKKRQDAIKHDMAALDELKSELYAKYLYKSPVMEVVWPCKRNRVLSNFKLVDTPGIKQELISKDITEKHEDYYNKADGVIWVIDANVLSKKGSLDGLEKMQAEELSANSENVIIVLNMIDKLRDSEGYSEGKLIREAVRLYGNKAKKVILLSAKEAMGGLLAKDENMIDLSGYNILVDRIEALFLQNVSRIKYCRKLAGFRGYISNLYNEVSVYISDLTNDTARYYKLEAKFNDDLKSRAKMLSKKIIEIIECYEESSSMRISDNVGSLLSINDENGTRREEKISSYISNVIFDEYRLQSIMNDINIGIKEEFESIISYWQKKSYFSKYKYINEASSLSMVSSRSVIMPSCALPGSNIDGAAVGAGALAGVIAASLLGPIGLVVGGLVWLFAGTAMHEENVRKTEAKLRSSLRSLKSDLIGQIENTIEEYVSHSSSIVNEIRRDSFKHKHCDIKKAYTAMASLNTMLDKMMRNLDKEVPRAAISDYFEGGKTWS